MQLLNTKPLVTAFKSGIFTACISAVMLLGCTEEVKVGSNGTGMAAPVDDVGLEAGLRGLGPTQIGSVNTDDSAAAISINSQIFTASSNLRLGMQVNAVGVPAVGAGTTAGTTAKLTQLVAQSAVRGPVQKVDAVLNEITVLNRAYRIDFNTILSGVDRVSNVAVGNYVEIFSLPAAPQSAELATRVVRVSTSFNPATDAVEVLGRITALSAGGFALPSVQVNNAVFATAIPLPGVPQTTAPAPTPLGAAALVRVVGSLNAAGGVDATRIITALEPVRKLNAEVQLEGLVQEISGNPITRLKVANTSIDVSRIATETLNQVRLNARVEITSTLSTTSFGQGLIATKLRVVPAEERIEFALEGVVSDFISAASFVVQGEQINAMQASISGGSITDIANGKRVKLRAQAGAGRMDAKTIAILP
jgi:Domain of unknown function (DUF5666)